MDKKESGVIEKSEAFSLTMRDLKRISGKELDALIEKHKVILVNGQDLKLPLVFKRVEINF